MGKPQRIEPTITVPSRFQPSDQSFIDAMKRNVLAGLSGQGGGIWDVERDRAERQLLSAAQRAGVLSSTGAGQTSGLLTGLHSDFGARRAAAAMQQGQSLLGALAGSPVVSQPQYAPDPLTQILMAAVPFLRF